MHQQIYELLQPIRSQRGARIAIAAPRGYAKSTVITLAYVLWCLCYKYEEFILIISDTASQADDLLGHVKNELETNLLLRASFPEVCEDPDASSGPPRWRTDEIITHNHVKVMALGAGKNIRGRRYKQVRPSLIIADDLENDEKASSAIQREKTALWWQKAIVPAGSALTNIIVVGTLLHYESLLAKLLTTPGWTGRKFKAVLSFATHQNLWERWASIYNFESEHEGKLGPQAAKVFFYTNKLAMREGTEVLWPQMEEYEALMELKLNNGQASFDSEKQNEPIDPNSCIFRESEIRFWDDQFDSEEELIASIGLENIRIIGACDPSLGKAGRSRDDTAIVTLLQDTSTGILYVLDADIRKRNPDGIIQAVIEYHQRRGYSAFAFETVQFQEFLAQELIKRSRMAGLEVPVVSVKPVMDKIGRIQSLQPKVSNGGIRFCHKHHVLLEQLRQFPKAAHDDGPDALEMAVSLASKANGPQISFVYKTPIRPGSSTHFLSLEPEAEVEETWHDIFQRRFRDFLEA